MELLLILHNVRSLYNVGSMFRTADAVGVKKIYLTGYTPSPHDFFGKPRKDFFKTALGAEKYVPFEQKKNIKGLLKSLSAKGKVFIVSLEQSPRAVPYNAFRKKYDMALRRCGILALIVGNEVRGLSQAILKQSDAIIEIPMHGRKESLNVSVAAGIALFEFSKLIAV